MLPAEDHRAWSADGAVRLRLTETGPQAVTPVSVPTLFRGVVERLPGGLALRTRGPAGEYRDWTFDQYHQDVRCLGSVLRLLRVMFSGRWRRALSSWVWTRCTRCRYWATTIPVCTCQKWAESTPAGSPRGCTSAAAPPPASTSRRTAERTSSWPGTPSSLPRQGHVSINLTLTKHPHKISCCSYWR